MLEPRQWFGLHHGAAHGGQLGMGQGGSAGGMLFRSLFGGPAAQSGTGAAGATGGGGIGMMDILLLGGIVWLALKALSPAARPA